MKLVFHCPVQQYGFLEINGTEKDLPEMEKLYNLYAESPLSFKKRHLQGGFDLHW